VRQQCCPYDDHAQDEAYAPPNIAIVTRQQATNDSTDAGDATQGHQEK
jgi:hypothetical protein